MSKHKRGVNTKGETRMEQRSWKIDKEKRADELKAWLDYQISLREKMIEESEFDSGIQAPCDMQMHLMGETFMSVKVKGIENIARILGGDVKTVNSPSPFDGVGGVIKMLEYGDYTLYEEM